MSEHCNIDVYEAEASTAVVMPGINPGDPPTEVTLGIDEAALQVAYDESCAPASMAFEAFREAVEADANAQALAQYPAMQAINDAGTAAGGTNFRIVWVRVCIRLGWVTIYLRWHI